ncbi:MAG: glycoside hydrolase family 1 protein [Chloroflexi bacterium]|nr:glycoside hydrolase family 1 protein [Chloroflexota bacterium]
MGGAAQKPADHPIPQAPGTHAGTFMFATGIECSYPVVLGRDGRPHRQDELEKCDHYRYWRDDLRLVREDMRLTYLRYGPPLHRVFLGPGRYDWAFTDDVLAEMHRLGIVPIVDLCHFGTPDWLGNSFQNPDFPRYLGEYARAFAERFPWVRYYTPVNEIYVGAKFSGLLGWWNERLTTERGFVTALKHMCLASLYAMEQILAVRPDAVFVQSESSEYYHQSCTDVEAAHVADFENQRRFLALDMLYAHPLRADMERFVREQGVTIDELDYFMNNRLGARCVMGNDYYVTNEHMVMHDGSIRAPGEVFGWYLVTREYYERYHRPVMHTETNMADESGATDWLWKQWHNVQYMRYQGVPVLGFTWFSLTDQVDWDTALREDNGHVNALGLYDLNRTIRPVGREYQELIREFRTVPVVPNAPYFGVP